MTYEEFIKGINNRTRIKQINFYIKNYHHYKNCSIGRYIDNVKTVQKKINGRITCILTEDHSEDVSFYGDFSENYKLFDLGSKGKYTLKDIWNNIVITKIEFFK